MTNFNKENKKTIMAISFATVVTLTLIFAPSATLVDAGETPVPNAPTCFDRDGNEKTATIYKKFPNDDTSDTWVFPNKEKDMDRLATIDFDGWKVGGSKAPGGDVIVGSHLSDKINGGKGSDVICGDDPRATDTIGDDKISGGFGDDDMWGTYGFTDIGPDEDELRGGQGNDVMWGQGGPDTIIGGQGDDKAFCSQAADDGDDDVVKLGRGIDATENCDSIGDTVNLGNPA